VTAAPGELAEAIAALLAGESRSKLATSAREVSERYRSGSGSFVQSPEDVLAYVATRLPATRAAAGAALAQVADLLPGFAPSSQLDLGAGPGAAAWAAAAVWPAMATVELRDTDALMLRAGEQLAAGRLGTWMWQHADMLAELPEADLVTASYALGELEPPDAVAVALRAWHAARGCLVIVEPGTPGGFRLIGRLRQELIEAGASIVAPCPDSGPCPIAGADWCHFSARVARSALHRSLKEADRSFEDEKFSYVAFARGEPSPAPGRVVRRALHRRRFVQLSVCRGGAIEQVGIGQSQPAYRLASKLSWGDAVPTAVVPST
jgi:ribosomal protein RSM22 (predicted rRNA methylase)